MCGCSDRGLWVLAASVARSRTRSSPTHDNARGRRTAYRCYGSDVARWPVRRRDRRRDRRAGRCIGGRVGPGCRRGRAELPREVWRSARWLRGRAELQVPRGHVHVQPARILWRRDAQPRGAQAVRERAPAVELHGEEAAKRMSRADARARFAVQQARDGVQLHGMQLRTAARVQARGVGRLSEPQASLQGRTAEQLVALGPNRGPSTDVSVRPRAARRGRQLPRYCKHAPGRELDGVSGPRTRAACWTRPSTRLTPSEKFAATTTGATAASSATMRHARRRSSVTRSGPHDRRRAGLAPAPAASRAPALHRDELPRFGVGGSPEIRASSATIVVSTDGPVVPISAMAASAGA